MMKTMNKAYEYCKQCIDAETTPIYVKKQMKAWMRICEGKDETYFVSDQKVKQLYSILKLLKMPKGLRAGESLFD